MSRKKKHEHVNHERWLVSYADFITLLFAFFVVLFASGQADKKKQKQLATAMQAAFSQAAIFEPHSKAPALNDGGSGGTPDTLPVPVELPMQAARDSARDPAVVQKQMEQMIAAQVARGALHGADVSVRPTPEGLTLSLHEGGFFDSGSAELREVAKPALLAIAVELPQGGVRVEGHTDNQPMHSALYASNWELSSARASAIARFLLEHSTLHPDALSVAGYAEFHPVASNGTEEGRAANRRVDLVLLKAVPAAAPVEAATPKAATAAPNSLAQAGALLRGK